MKIYTTGVALDLLGADYRWRTSVYAMSQPDANGSVQGDLILYGRGAPDLVARSKDEDRGSLAKLADDLYARGVRSVSGNVVGDESYFRGDPLGDGWQWNDLQWYFGAEASALSVNGNEVDINFVPSEQEQVSRRGENKRHRELCDGAKPHGCRKTAARVRLSACIVDSRTTTLKCGVSLRRARRLWCAALSSQAGALGSEIVCESPQDARHTVEGQTLARDSRVAPSQSLIHRSQSSSRSLPSQPLSEIAKKTNKESNNLYAELILRTLGRERGEMAALPEATGRERGDDEAGLAVIRVVAGACRDRDGRLALHDGSGLSGLIW